MGIREHVSMFSPMAKQLVKIAIEEQKNYLNFKNEVDVKFPTIQKDDKEKIIIEFEKVAYSILRLSQVYSDDTKIDIFLAFYHKYEDSVLVQVNDFFVNKIKETFDFIKIESAILPTVGVTITASW